MLSNVLNCVGFCTKVTCLSAFIRIVICLPGMGYESILELLLLKPYIYELVNNPEMNGWTAAHLAALRNRAGCLAILIGYAADVHAVKDKVGPLASNMVFS